MAMTVSQLAHRVLPGASAEEHAGVVRQLRHWTVSRVFPTFDPDNILTGTGRAREYSEDDIHLVALAVELGRWRLPMDLMRRVLQILRSHARLKWNEAVEGKENLYLVMYIPFNYQLQSTSVRIINKDDLMRYTERPQSVSTIVIALSKLFSRLKV